MSIAMKILIIIIGSIGLLSTAALFTLKYIHEKTTPVNIKSDQIKDEAITSPKVDPYEDMYRRASKLNDDYVDMVTRMQNDIDMKNKAIVHALSKYPDAIPQSYFDYIKADANVKEISR